MLTEDLCGFVRLLMLTIEVADLDEKMF